LFGFIHNNFWLGIFKNGGKSLYFGYSERATAIQRLNLAQAFNPIGLMLGLLAVNNLF
jgi:fucose permease|tara:strand:+ start:4736 stop:4909 length:174 start_codon:yes stop_codon:yes gene_type:complete